MEELIFFAVIIVFSILESIARSRKKRAGMQQIPNDGEPDRPYDDLDADDAADSSRPIPRYSEPYGSSPGAETTHRSGSEGMVPADIWQEIAGLARGRLEQMEKKPAPPPPPPTPSRVERGRRTPDVGEAHRVHRSHAGYGTDPSSRLPSAQDDLDPLARSLSADAASVRQQLRQGGRHALRRAMILQEILGPPASMRPEAFRD